MIRIITIGIAICISVAAATISVLGFMTIFPTIAPAVAAIVALLEAGKVIAAAFVKVYGKIVPRIQYVFLVSAVIILMGITSMGIYGFFAAARIQQQTAIKTSTAAVTIPVIENAIENRRALLVPIERSLRVYQQATDSLAQSTQKKDARLALREQRRNTKTIERLVTEQQQHLEKIADLNKQLIQNKALVERSNAELGPVRYVAQIIYGKPTQTQYETAVHWLIVILIFVFDPLAIILLTAALGTNNVRFQRVNAVDFTHVLSDNDKR